eukprot:CAMPEP_0171889272 /NCGR_PEP_ID=MMETSP0992-20121227/43487_1 /TAXON_ID=483369 /ORGANISM="non described non described, Strain CCMP2098" /LENGTH=201 /DNA_ID=CAMNT_0012516269 /DNA_START=165 /DNA_END=766 /DNA_ORIENTATION=+
MAVVVGQIFTLLYHWLHVRAFVFGTVVSVQRSGAEAHDFWRECIGHLSQPEGFVLLGAYLTGTWMFRLMPRSYYGFEGGIDWVAVAVQLVLQDTIQFAMHLLEHKVDDLLGSRKWFYRRSHKPHHRFTNPKLFDAATTRGTACFGRWGLRPREITTCTTLSLPGTMATYSPTPTACAKHTNHQVRYQSSVLLAMPLNFQQG